MINQSESIANLTVALSYVQGKMSHAVKDSANPFFKSKYADLESVWGACRDLLSAHGIAIMQFPGLYSELDKSMSLTTVISHKSGEWMSQEMSVPVTKADAQGSGSAITYMRRYALAAVVGVVQADDDGNAASNPASKPVNKPVVKSIEI
jgi:hypothetical protein